MTAPFLRTVCLDDELADGYKGRLMRVNGWRTAKEAMTTMLPWAGSGERSLRNFSSVEVLAEVAGHELPRFVQSHTLLPLRHAIVPGKPEDFKVGPDLRKTLQAFALRPMRKHAYFCLQCVNEILLTPRLVYWKRNHQIPGRFHCEDHGTPLIQTDYAEVTRQSPSPSLAAKSAPIPKWAVESKNSPEVQRYLSLCKELLSDGQPRDERVVSTAAAKRAEELGMHTGHGVAKKPTLSNGLMDVMCNTWVAEVLHAEESTQKADLASIIDATVSGRRRSKSSLAYALTYAFLFKTSKDAIQLLRGSVEPINKRRQFSRVPRTLHPIDLRASYIRNRGNHTAVATETGAHPFLTTTQLNDMGLPRIGIVKRDKILSLIEELFKGDISLKDLASKNDLDWRTVRNVLLGALTPLHSAMLDMADDSGASTEGRSHDQDVPSSN